MTNAKIFPMVNLNWSIFSYYENFEKPLPEARFVVGRESNTCSSLGSGFIEIPVRLRDAQNLISYRNR